MKRYFALLLTLILVFSCLVACSNGGEAKTGDEEGSGTEQSEGKKNYAKALMPNGEEVRFTWEVESEGSGTLTVTRIEVMSEEAYEELKEVGYKGSDKLELRQVIVCEAKSNENGDGSFSLEAKPVSYQAKIVGDGKDEFLSIMKEMLGEDAEEFSYYESEATVTDEEVMESFLGYEPVYYVTMSDKEGALSAHSFRETCVMHRGTGNEQKVDRMYFLEDDVVMKAEVDYGDWSETSYYRENGTLEKTETFDGEGKMVDTSMYDEKGEEISSKQETENGEWNHSATEEKVETDSDFENDKPNTEKVPSYDVPVKEEIVEDGDLDDSQAPEISIKVDEDGNMVIIQGGGNAGVPDGALQGSIGGSFEYDASTYPMYSEFDERGENSLHFSAATK